MYLQTGGGGKGIRPNQQHNQQQQQQQQQQGQHQQLQQQGQQQQQLHHHTNAQQLQQTTSVYNQGHSQQQTPHSHPQPLQQTQSQLSQQPISYYTYQITQVPQQQLAPPQHQSGAIINNGSQNNTMGASSTQSISALQTNAANGNSNNQMLGHPNSNGSITNINMQQQQQHMQQVGSIGGNNLQHYNGNPALMPTPLPPGAPFMTSTYMQQFHPTTAVMAATNVQYNNNVAGVNNLTGGANGSGVNTTIYSTPQQQQSQQQQTQQLHHSQQQHMQTNYFHAGGATASQQQMHQLHPATTHQLRSVMAVQSHPRQAAPTTYMLPPNTLFALPRPSLLPNPHQQANGAGGTVVQVPPLMQPPPRNGAPAAYMTPAFCQSSLPMAPGMPPPPTIINAAPTMGPSQLQTFAHYTTITASASSSSLSASNSNTSNENVKPRKHAIPIINPLTMEDILNPKPTKKSTSVEVKPSNLKEETNTTQTSTTAVTITTPNSTATTIDTADENKSTLSNGLSIPQTECLNVPNSNIESKKSIQSVSIEKIDQQMQTDKAYASVNKTTTPIEQNLQTTLISENAKTAPSMLSMNENHSEIATNNIIAIETKNNAVPDQDVRDKIQDKEEHKNENKNEIKQIQDKASTVFIAKPPLPTVVSKEEKTESKLRIINADEEKHRNKLQTMQKEQQSRPVATPPLIPGLVQIVKRQNSNQNTSNNNTNPTTTTHYNPFATPELPPAAAKASQQLKASSLCGTISSGNSNNNSHANMYGVGSRHSQRTTLATPATSTASSSAGSTPTHQPHLTNQNDNKPSVGGAVVTNSNTSATNNNLSKKNRKNVKREKRHKQQNTTNNRKDATQNSNNNNNNNTHNNNSNNNNRSNNTNSYNNGTTTTNNNMTDLNSANSTVNSLINSREQNSSATTAVSVSTTYSNSNRQQQQQFQFRQQSNTNNRHNRQQQKHQQQQQHQQPQQQIQLPQTPIRILTKADLKSELRGEEKTARPLTTTGMPNSSSVPSTPIAKSQVENIKAKEERSGEMAEPNYKQQTDIALKTNNFDNYNVEDENNSQEIYGQQQKYDEFYNTDKIVERTSDNSLGKNNNPQAELNNADDQSKQPTIIRYTLTELKQLSRAKDSRKPPLVPCQKGDCIAQLFVSRQHHHTHHMFHGQQGGNIQMPPHIQQQYHNMNFGEAIEFSTNKQRRHQNKKHHHDHHQANAGGSNSGGGGGVGIVVGGAHSVASSSNITAGNTIGNNNAIVGNLQFQRKMDIIHVNLSLKEEIKLSECENAWMPQQMRTRSSSATPANNDDLEAVLKKVRGVLNKLTPDNFDVLLKTMTSISINTPEKMQQVMLLIFEKTVSEPNFAPTYAKFCKVLFHEIKLESKALFSNLLITRIQHEFETNVNDADAKKTKLQPLVDKLETCIDSKERLELQAELEDQEYQFRRRAWGTVRFIGEMYKLQSLTNDRVFLCIESLLEHGCEEKLEYMCKLLTTVGHLLEGSQEQLHNNVRMDRIFRKIQEIVNKSRSNKPINNNSNNSKIKLSSRVRFMMQDVIDLRTRRWDQPTLQQQQQQQSHSQHRRTTSASSRQEDRNRPTTSSSNNDPSGSNAGFEKNQNRMGNYSNQAGTSRSMRNSSQAREHSYFLQKQQKSTSGFHSNNQQQDQSKVNIDVNKLNFSRGDEAAQGGTKLGNSSIYLWRTSDRQNGSAPIAPSIDNMSTPSSTTISNFATNPFASLGSNSNTNNTAGHNCRQKHQSLERPPQTMSPPEISSTSASSITSPTSSICSDTSAITQRECQQVINRLIEEVLDSSNWYEEALNTWRDLSYKQQVTLLHYLLMDHLHLADVKRLQRKACANIFAYLMRTQAFEKAVFIQAYKQFAEEFADLLVDVPNGWTYVFEFLGPILHERLLLFSDIWCPQWSEDSYFTERFLKAMILHFTTEFGINYTRDLWHKEYKLGRGQQFLSGATEFREFLNVNNFQYIERNYKANQTEQQPRCIQNHSTAEQLERIGFLLNSANDCDLAIDFINTNVLVNLEFLRNLTKFLCCDYATLVNKRIPQTTASSTECAKRQLNVELFREKCMPLMRLCMDANETHEIECIDEIVESLSRVYDEATANNLICSIFEVLYDCEVLSRDTFEKWHSGRKGATSTGVVLSDEVRQFLDKLL